MSKKYRKRTLLSLGIAALICAAACVLLSACHKAMPLTLDTSPCYELHIDCDLSGKTLSVNQEILYTSPADVDDVVLHVFANAFNSDNSAIDILSAQINRQNVDYELYGSDRTLLKLPCSLKKDETCTLTFKYTVALPTSDTRLGITAHGDANLTCFYPVVAKYDEGWREDCYSSFGDPFYCDTSSFYVTLTVDENLQVASSGRIIETKPIAAASKKSVEIQAENVRDFALAVGNFSVLSDEIRVSSKKVNVSYYYYDDPEPTQSLERATQSISVFSNAFGDYAHSEFCVVQSNLSDAGGMEYGSLVLVSPTDSREDYLDTITHETAHQWWYNAVGSDQINSAWLDEGLTEFCTYYFHYLVGDRAQYRSQMASISRSYSSFSALKGSVGFDGRMNRPLSSYLTEGEYVAVSYFKGALLFDAFRTLVGDKKFQAAMQHYYKSNIYGIATQDCLIAAFKAQGYNVASIVNGWTDDTAII